MRSWRSDDIYRPIGSRNILLYDGPSRLNGARILVIATAQNGNRKIGHMLQLWIIPSISPLAALRSGADAAVCGDCPHRGNGRGQQRSCYVWSPGVDNIWQARAKAIVMTPRHFAVTHPGLQLRIGAYGDPVAVPIEIWTPLLERAAGWTAYTHQWRLPLARPFRQWCMASVDSAAEQREASLAGWRTFRVRGADDGLQADEITCPASAEAGHRVVCADCELCRGAARQAKSIAIVAHGGGAKYVGRVFPLTEVSA